VITRSARLKDQPGHDLINYGTSRFDNTLLRDHLIDEFRLTLAHDRRRANGSVILTYTPG
jgi:hypothetical protein